MQPFLVPKTLNLTKPVRLLPVAKRVRRRRVALAVLWAGERCAEPRRRMLPAR
jgi:hypothetical protein